MGPHQDKNLPHSKGTINKTKRQPSEWEKMPANDLSDKGLISKINKEFSKFNIQKNK